MAFRIDKAIIKGWLDNTTPGVTEGAIEIVGFDRPVKLTLRGNCCRDLAGTRIDFKNPHPIEQKNVLAELHTLQRGVVGTMTASHRCKVPAVDEDQLFQLLEAKEPIPTTWKNCLHLEWFSLVNGRVVLESPDFDIKISHHQWEMDADGDKQQQLENSHAIEHFMQIMLTASEAQAEVSDVEGEVDEFEWERRLRVRDTLDEAAWFLSEGKNEGHVEIQDIADQTLESQDPLVQYAILVQNNALDLLGNTILDAGPHCNLAMAIGYLCEILEEIWPTTQESKLETGYILAMLKRTLDACNEAIAACNTLAMEDDHYEDLRTHIFHLRDLIIDRTHVLREKS